MTIKDTQSHVNLIDGTTKYMYGAKWFLIYQQHYLTGLFNGLNPLFNVEKGRFSLLNQITDEYKINGLFEFLYESPSDDLYIRWRQSQNPLDIQEGVDTVEGLYIFPESSMPIKTDYCSFNGLAKSNYSASLLDGCRTASYWNWAVLMFDSTHADKMFPTTKWTDELVLWMRIPNSSRCINNYIGKNPSIWLLLFIM